MKQSSITIHLLIPAAEDLLWPCKKLGSKRCLLIFLSCSLDSMIVLVPSGERCITSFSLFVVGEMALAQSWFLSPSLYAVGTYRHLLTKKFNTWWVLYLQVVRWKTDLQDEFHHPYRWSISKIFLPVVIKFSSCSEESWTLSEYRNEGKKKLLKPLFNRSACYSVKTHTFFTCLSNIKLV